MIKTFRRCIKVFLTLEISKSVLKELIFAKSGFLDLINFGFLDLADFVVVDRSSILLPTLQLPSPPVSSGLF